MTDQSDLWWYALKTPPQREFAAQHILENFADRGIKTFVPVRKEWRRRNRYSKAKELRSYPVMPRYVFAGFEPGRARWYDLFKFPVLVGVVGVCGEPRRVRYHGEDGLGSFIGRYPNGITAPKEQRFMRSNHEFAIGDTVEVIGGPFDGQKVPVLEISGEKALVNMYLFGAEQKITVRLEDLSAA